MPVYAADPTGPSVDNQGEPESNGANEPIGVRRRLMDGVRQHDVSGLSAEIAYRFLFAVFPFGLFVAALGAFVAGLLHVENPAQLILNGLGDNLPPDIAASLRPELERLLGAGQPGLLRFGALLALWAATGGTNALVKGIHRAYGVPEQRPFLLRYAVAIGLTILAAVGAILSFVTIVGGALITQQLAQGIGCDQAFCSSRSCAGRRVHRADRPRSPSSTATPPASSSLARDPGRGGVFARAGSSRRRRSASTPRTSRTTGRRMGPSAPSS